MNTNRYACPTCRRSTAEGDPFFPFCSERCRMVDLGAWLDERYKISRSPSPTDRDDPLTAGEMSEDASSEGEGDE